MFTEIQKDVTTVQDGIVLHGCNCVGGFGSGVAGAIRRVWPWVYEAFVKNGTGPHLMGTVDIVTNDAYPELTVINGYTQETCGNDGKRYADIAAVDAVVIGALIHAQVTNKDLYLPKIGAGLGGLSWENEVKPLFLKVSEEFPEVNMFVCDL